MTMQGKDGALQSVLFSFARLLFCVFLVITSLYCLLAYIPFTYHWVVKGELLAWLPVFVKYHPCFFLAALGLASPTVARDMQRVATRSVVLGFYVFHIAAGAWMIFKPVLPALENDVSSLKWALIFLTPLVWLTAIDFAGHIKQTSWSQETKDANRQPTLKTIVTLALFLSILYAVICYLRFRTMVSFSKSELLVIAIWTTVSHLLIFLTVFIAASLARNLSNRQRDPARAYFVATSLLTALFGALVVRYVVLAGISFDGPLANMYAISVSFLVTFFVAGVRLRIRERSQSRVDNRIDDKPEARVHGQAWVRLSPFPWPALWIISLVTVAYIIPANVARMDWDFLMQKLSVLAVWTATFVVWNKIMKARTSQPVKPYPIWILILIVVVGFGGYRLISASESRVPGLLRNDKLNVNATLEAYATYDISFKVAHQVLSNIADFSISRFLYGSSAIVPTANASNDDGEGIQPNEDNGFYGYLKRNTNLMPAVKVEPVDVKLVENMKSTTSVKPNIFIFVVDSLRPDYLSPYNDKVTFTPNIDAFARESVVMENAFTPYGGTVLAEPALWTGTMQIHKQYIEPFYPMNALQKLIDADGYHPFITVDPVLKIILKPSTSIIELDQDATGWQGLDLVKTLGQLRAKMEERQDKSRPVFAYTQAQNLHVHKLNRERREGPPAIDINGFEPYYASQIKYIDEGLGEFIRYLKESGQYDNSIIVLTSDHGDSLGEGGRWGHANWIFPEILKIPIIIHIPTIFRNGLYWDSSSIAFLNDITPSLYYMLGHRPIVRNDVFGKPLFTETKEEQADYRKRSYMVASSYGPTYGILGDNGRSLFISDAANGKDYYFNLRDDPQGTRNLVDDRTRSANEKLIRRNIGAISSFFHYNPE
jgi:hypothetical protein